MKTAINPTREQNYPEWYQEVIKAADLAEHSSVRGCMVVKPWGYGIWENIQSGLDSEFKKRGVQNAYFPLFIPLSFLQREAEHVEGFAKECAVVTHSKLEKDKDGNLVPAAELEEPLIVRPTSETIIGESFAKWIQSYRDLPLQVNQWCNIVRWEMRTRLFLRTAEILWQEGHTAHATREEADKKAREMLDVYTAFHRDILAVPVYPGVKTPRERFPGATETYTFEAMMQDGKALQGGTSHFLGQNFSKACDIKFRTKEGGEEHAWTTSWGCTTRLIGTIIMTHSDDNGLILPPRIAPSQAVILPIIHKEEHRKPLLDYCRKLQQELTALNYHGKPLRVELDDRDLRAGEKGWSWIKKGIPLRLEIGMRELEADSVTLLRRTDGPKESTKVPVGELLETITATCDAIQKSLYEKALAFNESHLHKIGTKEEFYKFFDKGGKGFVLAGWGEDDSIEERIQKDLSVTVRCLPDAYASEKGTCPFTGKTNMPLALYAKSY